MIPDLVFFCGSFLLLLAILLLLVVNIYIYIEYFIYILLYLTSFATSVFVNILCITKWRKILIFGKCM